MLIYNKNIKKVNFLKQDMNGILKRGMYMSDITVSSDGISAIVFGNIIKANNPTELFVCVIAEILKTHPEIIGKKETHFTSDKSRADKYTGTTRQIFVNGTKVYIKTGFSTKDKIDGIKKTCQLAGIIFRNSSLYDILMSIEDFDDVDNIRNLIMPYKWEDLSDTDKNNLLHPNLSPNYNSKIAMSVDELRDERITLGWVSPKTLQVLLAPYKQMKNGNKTVENSRGTSSARETGISRSLDIDEMLSVCGYSEANIRNYLQGYGSNSLMSRDLKLLQDMARFLNNTDDEDILEGTLKSVDELSNSDDLSKVSLKALAILVSPYVSSKSVLDDFGLSLIEDLLTEGTKERVLQDCIEGCKQQLEGIVNSTTLNISQELFNKVALISAKALVLEILGKVK